MLLTPARGLARESKAGGERGIRTPGAFRHHWFSRPAPSTTRPSLQDRKPALAIIAENGGKVNGENVHLEGLIGCFLVDLVGWDSFRGVSTLGYR